MDIERMQAFADAEHARQPVCSDCGELGTPYEHNGVRHDGLIADHGDRVCSPCMQVRSDTEGVNILVVDDRPGHDPYIHNTVRDADKISIQLPRELRGIDGRDRLTPRRARNMTRSRRTPQDPMAAAHQEAVDYQTRQAELRAREENR